MVTVDALLAELEVGATFGVVRYVSVKPKFSSSVGGWIRSSSCARSACISRLGVSRAPRARIQSTLRTLTARARGAAAMRAFAVTVKDIVRKKFNKYDEPIFG